MNNDLNHPESGALPPGGELEAQITARLLGELSDAEARALDDAIAQDPALARLEQHLARTLEFVREAAAKPAEPSAGMVTQPRMASPRREQLLARLREGSTKGAILGGAGGDADGRSPETVIPVMFAEASGDDRSTGVGGVWLVLAACLVGLLVVASMMLEGRFAVLPTLFAQREDAAQPILVTGSAVPREAEVAQGTKSADAPVAITNATQWYFAKAAEPGPNGGAPASPARFLMGNVAEPSSASGTSQASAAAPIDRLGSAPVALAYRGVAASEVLADPASSAVEDSPGKPQLMKRYGLSVPEGPSGSASARGANASRDSFEFGLPIPSPIPTLTPAIVPAAPPVAAPAAASKEAFVFDGRDVGVRGEVLRRTAGAGGSGGGAENGLLRLQEGDAKSGDNRAVPLPTPNSVSTLNAGLAAGGAVDRFGEQPRAQVEQAPKLLDRSSVVGDTRLGIALSGLDDTAAEKGALPGAQVLRSYAGAGGGLPVADGTARPAAAESPVLAGRLDAQPPSARASQKSGALAESRPAEKMEEVRQVARELAESVTELSANPPDAAKVDSMGRVSREMLSKGIARNRVTDSKNQPALGDSLVVGLGFDSADADTTSPAQEAKVAEASESFVRLKRKEVGAQDSVGGRRGLERDPSVVSEPPQGADKSSLRSAAQRVWSAKPGASTQDLDLVRVELADTDGSVAPAPVPQPEVVAAENAFSTFSLNVSDVSYKLAAASLEGGQLPAAASVRTEEFLNAFQYRDPEPAPGVPVGFVWERAQYPFAQQRDVLRLSVRAAAQGREAARPMNLVLLLDSSGSMERSDRVAIVREALRVLAGQLQSADRVSVVTFARTARLWIDGLPGHQAGELPGRVGELTPEGGTHLEAALALGYETALKHFVLNGINRVVLLTDGAANLGELRADALRATVEEHRRRGVALDCFGIGFDGYQDDLLEALSRNGDGRYGFVNSPEDAANGFANQLAGALQVAASDVKVQVEFNPRRITAWRQVGYARHQLTQQQFRDNTVDAAELAAREAGNALYVMETKPRGEGPIGTVRVRFRKPSTQEYSEHEWVIPYSGPSVPLDQSSPAMRLAVVASSFGEVLAASPFAAEMSPERLLGLLNGIPEAFQPDTRPRQLEQMLRQSQSLQGNR